jgi:hypothetical protein
MLSRRKIIGVADRIIYVLLTAVICGSFAIVAAQADDVSGEAFKGARELRKREVRAAKEIDKYAEQLDKTTRSLSRLGRADGNEARNPRNRYESFSGELKKLEEAQERAVSSLDKMKASGVEYFSAWEKANASISDAALREAAATRRSRSLIKHINLARALGDIGLQLQPLMSSLRDLRAFLGADLSPGNVRTAGERIQACQSEAEALKSSIAEVQRMFKKFLSEMTE